jgi:hypothetical protein
MCVAVARLEKRPFGKSWKAFEMVASSEEARAEERGGEGRR